MVKANDGNSDQPTVDPGEDVGRAEGTFTRRGVLQRGAIAGLSIAVLPGLGRMSSASGIALDPIVRGGTLVIGLNDGGPSDDLDPAKQAATVAGITRAQQAYEKLFQWDANMAHAVPWLATSATPNRSATVWQLKLRQGVTFHNGKPFTAEDVLATWRHYLNPKVGAAAAGLLAPIDLRATKQISPHELEVHLKYPIGDFAGLLANQFTQIFPAGYSDWTHENGTGPFTLVNYQPGVRAQYARNADWWNAGHGRMPYIDELELVTLSDPTARLNSLLSGQTQGVSFLSAVQARELESNSASELLVAWPGQYIPVTMRLDREPFTDRRVRLAFKLAIDRHQVLKSALGGRGKIGNDIPGLGFPSYNSSLPQHEYEPDRAKSLLKQAGHDGITITLPTSSNAPGMLETATVYKESAKRAGININLRILPADQYFSNKLYLHNNFYMDSWGGPFALNASILLVGGSVGNGETAWHRPQWDAAFRKAQGTVDPDKRNAAYKALQEPLWSEGGYIIPAFAPTIDAISSKVRGLAPSKVFLLGDMEFFRAWITK